MLNYNQLPLRSGALEVHYAEGKKNKSLKVHYLHGESLSPSEEEKCIVVLPGLDDSVFYYEHALNLFREMNPQWSLMAIDLRGQGRTFDEELSISDQKVPLEQQAEILEKVLSQLNIRKVFLVALSYGAGVSMTYAQLHHHRLLGLGLIAPYVTKFKRYKPGVTGLYYSLVFMNPFYKSFSRASLAAYFYSAKLKNRLNPNVNWTSKRLDALTKLTLGILDLETDQALDRMPHLPLGIHLLTACQDTVIPITAHRHFYNRIPKSMDKTFSLEDGIGHRVLQQHPKRASKWLHRVLS